MRLKMKSGLHSFDKGEPRPRHDPNIINMRFDGYVYQATPKCIKCIKQHRSNI